jgi:hypothetical protein
MIYDQNAYGNMREVLKALGITANNKKDYNTQFGISLNNPNLQPIVPVAPLLLTVAASGTATSNSKQTLIAKLQADFNIQPGETDMLTMDIPNTPPQSPIIVQARAEKSGTQDIYGTMGVCYVSPTAEQINPVRDAQGYYSLDIEGSADDIFFNGPHMERLELNYDNAIVTVLQPPKHGTLKPTMRDASGNDLSHGLDTSYYPNAGYTGNDKAIFLVTVEGYKIKVVYFIKVIANYDIAHPDFSKCPDPNPWQISSNVPSALTAVLANASQAMTGFATLPGGAVGETTGTSITLDTNAAGYGWYVDPNPSSNTDFLPTSNPDVWMAKAGSAAAGKMDMLSVLLHEYGHALGLDHSANPNDFMAPNLQPGERRLPSASELAQLSQLATQLASTNNPAAPDNPTSPALPVGTALSALLIVRLRRTGYGSWTPVIDSIQIPAPQFERAVTLCNLSVTLK